MKKTKPFNLALLSLLTSLAAFQSLASETLDSHEHGSASLNIAIDDNVIAIQFESPAVNIVGFEHAPNNEEEQSLITEAKNKLANFDATFKLQGAPVCHVVQSSANWVTEHDEHDKSKEHDEHDKSEEHDEHDEHDEDGAIESEHAEFTVEFKLQCNQVNKLDAIDVSLMALFPAISEIDAQVIYPGGQIKQELTINETLIKLKVLQ